jgi:hypothetical protein
MGRSRGGLTSKIIDRPYKWAFGAARALTASEAHDNRLAGRLLRATWSNATRYDKLAAHDLAYVQLASIHCGSVLMSPRPNPQT